MICTKRKGIFLVLLLTIVILIQGCADPGDCETPTSYTIEDGVILLDKEGSIPCELCEERGFHDKIIVLESKHCGACKVAVPKIKEAAEELGVDVLFLDLSEEADTLKMMEFKIQPYYTPTMLIGCNVHIGGKSKEEYVGLISEFLENEH